MTSLLLFCVAAVPIATINTLLSTPDGVYFSLVRDPSQNIFDPRGTTPPVDEFTSGFIGHSVVELQSFTTLHVPSGGLVGTFIESGRFAVLDERSQHDDTAIIWFSQYPDITREPDPDDDIDEGFTEPEQWYSWRVKFEDVVELVTDLSFTFEMWPSFCLTHLVGEDGVYDVKGAVRHYLEGGI